MPPLHHYIEEQEKKFDKNFNTVLWPVHDMREDEKGDVHSWLELTKSFHTASLNGLVDLIEKWARNNWSFKYDKDGRKLILLDDLLTFLGRDTK